MNLDSVIQNKMSQKNKCCTLMHIYGIYKNGADKSPMLGTVLKEAYLETGGFLSSSDSKESACNVRDPGSIPGWEDPLEKG